MKPVTCWLNCLVLAIGDAARVSRHPSVEIFFLRSFLQRGHYFHTSSGYNLTAKQFAPANFSQLDCESGRRKARPVRGKCLSNTRSVKDETPPRRQGFGSVVTGSFDHRFSAGALAALWPSFDNKRSDNTMRRAARGARVQRCYSSSPPSCDKSHEKFRRSWDGSSGLSRWRAGLVRMLWLRRCEAKNPSLPLDSFPNRKYL